MVELKNALRLLVGVLCGRDSIANSKALIDLPVSQK